MTLTNEELTDLLLKQLASGLTEAEQALLDEWAAASVHHRRFLADLSDEETLRRQLLNFRAPVRQAAEERVLAKINKAVFASAPVAQRPVHRVHFLKTAWFRYAAAIVLLVGISVAGYFVATNNDIENDIARHEKPKTTNPAENISPGSNKAILTLSDGRKIELDSATSGTITDQHLSIENNNGQLRYGTSELVAYNTMTTPRGGQYQVVLPDGTKVWLNAASSITYPTAFMGNNRTVTIEGEAYFEVAKDAKKPFIVKTYRDEITVLGTAFNINAYKDEQLIKTSLVEGSVRINEKILQPGLAYVNGKISKTNIQQDIAWKNGAFDFQDASVGAVLRQIARWYDLEPVYPSGIPSDLITGTMGRDLKLTQVLDLLEELGVKVRLEGKQLIVTR